MTTRIMQMRIAAAMGRSMQRRRWSQSQMVMTVKALCGPNWVGQQGRAAVRDMQAQTTRAVREAWGALLGEAVRI